MAFDKSRFRFRKDGNLRLVSHHDLMRAFERMLRRAELPFRSTEGFHPQPRVVFALSLPLGIAGREEVVEIEWMEPIEPPEALARLARQAPAGLSFFSAVRVDLRQAARPRRAVYRLPIPESEIVELRRRCEAIMAAPELWVARERPRPREVNVRPYLNALRCGADDLLIDVWVTQDGSARADELARELGLAPLIDAGAVIERTVLEIEDEVDPAILSERPAMPSRDDRAARERPLKQSPETAPPLQAAHSAHWGASPSGPIVE
jgi:radical SAM-linked protein